MSVIRRHGPILLTVGSIALGFLGMVALGNDPLPLPPSGAHVRWFLAGIFYMQLLEYAIHRFLMHGRLPGFIRRNHVHHHKTFHGDRFRSRNPVDLASIPGGLWVFPVVGGAHYAVLSVLAPPGTATVFTLAAASHYGVFEVTHWLTHVDNNGVDRALGKVPALGAFWAREIEHHRVHHETPVRAFNFTFPYTGDRIAEAIPGAAARAPEFRP
jgi:hypothetical protein